MDLIDIMMKVYEFSEKGEEFSDEIKTFRATLDSLRTAVEDIGINNIPKHLISVIEKDVKESEELMSKVQKNNSSWMTNIRNMLPGSPLMKIKEKGEQLLKSINLLSLHLNTNKIGRRPTKNDEEEFEEPKKLKKLHTFDDQSGPYDQLPTSKKSLSEIAFAPTLEEPEDMMGATQPDNPDEFQDSEVAFKLRVLYDERLGAQLKNSKDFIPIIEKRWNGKDQVEYVFQRVDYMYLPPSDIQKVSREHTTLTAIRKVHSKPKPVNHNTAFDATVPDDNQMFAATVADDNGMFSATVADDGNDGNGEAMVEERNEYILTDLSLNGTYYIKGTSLLNFPSSGMKIQADFQRLEKGEKTTLRNGDIIALIAQKPHCKDLVFGFQFLEE